MWTLTLNYRSLKRITGALLSAKIRSSDIFVYIVRQLFTYKRIKLVLFTLWDRLGQGFRHICLHTTSFVDISDVRFRLIYTT